MDWISTIAPIILTPLVGYISMQFTNLKARVDAAVTKPDLDHELDLRLAVIRSKHDDVRDDIHRLEEKVDMLIKKLIDHS